MKLSEHFTLDEMCATQYAHVNSPNKEQLVYLCLLCNLILEPLRQRAGEPIFINSGFRSPAVNKAVGGVWNSQHLLGCAADIRIKSPEHGKRLFNILRDLYWVDQCLFEKSSSSMWLHVSFSWTPRHYFNDQYIVR